MKRKARMLMIMIVCLLLTAGFQTAVAKEQLRIGLLQPFTGDLARFGIECYEGHEIARIEQNEKGGLLGKEIVYVKGDAVDPKVAVTEAERLITKEHVDIILGTYASSLSMVASEVANKHKKLYWETDGNSDKLTQRGYPYYFRTNPPASRYTEWSPLVIKDYILPRIGKTTKTVRIAGLHEDSLFGTTMGEYITKNVKKAGMDFVYSEFYNRKTIDLSSIIMKLKQANPDILMATQYLVDLIAFWRQCKELNYSPPIYLGSGAGVSMPDFINAVGAIDAEGMMEMSFAAPLAGVNPKYGSGMQEFLKRYKSTFGRDCVSMYQAPNYAGAQLLFAAISKAGSTNPEDVRNAALSLDMPYGTLVVGWGAKFDTSGQNIRTKVLACQWLDGKVWAVWPPEATIPGKEMKIPLPNWEQRKKMSK